MTTPLNPYFTESNILFVSINKETGDEKDIIGSIYFNNGRIRLTHKSDPKVYVCKYARTEYYSMSKDGYIDYEKWRKDSHKISTRKKYDYVTKILKCEKNEASNDNKEFFIGQKLIEFFFDSNDNPKSSHLSRGGPDKSLNDKFNQSLINKIYKTANFRDNNTFYNVMEADFKSLNIFMCEKYLES